MTDLLAPQIEQKQAEISSYETELERLRGELERLRRVQIEPKSDTPQAKAEARVKESSERAKRQPQIMGTEQAIAQLEGELQGLRSQLASLQQQQAAIERQKRLEEAHAAIKSHIDRIAKASATLESEIWLLKELYDRHKDEFRESQVNPHPDNHGYRWQPLHLVAFSSTEVLELVEAQGNYVLAARRVDLFAKEHQAAEQERLEKLLFDSRQREKTRRDVERQRLAIVIGRLTEQQQEIAASIAGNEEMIARYAPTVQEWQQHQKTGQGIYSRTTPVEVYRSQSLGEETTKLKTTLSTVSADLAEAQERLADLDTEG